MTGNHYPGELRHQELVHEPRSPRFVERARGEFPRLIVILLSDQATRELTEGFLNGTDVLLLGDVHFGFTHGAHTDGFETAQTVDKAELIAVGLSGSHGIDLTTIDGLESGGGYIDYL